MAYTSPFTQYRYEHEQDDIHHLYYLPDQLFTRLTARHPVYLVGSRGTGKTTLLSALGWRQQLQNPSLRRQLQLQSAATPYVGVYFKLPETQIQTVGSWAAGWGSEDVVGKLTAFYIDLLAIQSLAEALACQSADGVRNFSPESEALAVSRILAKYREYPAFACAEGLAMSSPGPTLQTLSEVVRRVRTTLEKHANRGRASLDTIDDFPLLQFGEFGRAVASDLHELCSQSADEGSGQLYFKVCMDEGEHLTYQQLHALNSMVRLSKAPLFFVVAFVAPPDDCTLLNGMSLQKADRALLVLDDNSMSDLSFRELAECVATVRVRALCADNDVKVSLVDILGQLNLNGLLEQMLRDSVQPSAKELLGAAEDAALLGKEKTADTSSLPVYQTYLQRVRQRKGPDAGVPKWDAYRHDSKEIRKRMVTAYLSICHDLRKQYPLYASAPMVLQMSDKCIRDFLWQLHEVFIEAGVSVDAFVSSVVPSHIQDAALRRASEQKRRRAANYMSFAPSQTERLIDGLGLLSAMIQSRGSDYPVLLTSERGVFVVELTDSDPLADALRGVLEDATEAGYLKTLRYDGASMQFRMHTSLAAAFGFSYRGAYTERLCLLSTREMDRFFRAKDDDEVRQAVEAVFGRIVGENPNQMEFSF